MEETAIPEDEESLNSNIAFVPATRYTLIQRIRKRKDCNQEKKVEFIRSIQLNLMIFLSGICFVLAILSYLTKTMPKKRRLCLIHIQLGASLLLMMDRFAYIYRGDVSTTGWWMVRISNFSVFFITLFLIYFFNMYLIDLLRNEGGLSRTPKRFIAVQILLAVELVLLIVSQFTGLYYTFDATNHYQRARFFPVCYIVPLSCMVIQLSVVWQYHKRLRTIVWLPIFLFDLLPFVAALIQFFAYGISVQNLTMVGLIILLYIFVIVDMNKTVEKANRIEVEILRQEQQKMRTLFEQTAAALANAIDAKDKYTHGHSTRVAEYSKQIAVLAGKSEEECEDVYFAGLLHDIGKIGVPDRIINKEGKLTDEEFNEIKKHPVIGNQILSTISKSPYLSIGAHYHHERYDGHGYPDGLKGTDIPDIARIIAVADAYDAMTSKRSYRNPIPQQKVREEIVKGMYTQFDPLYSKLMIHLIDQDTEYKMREHSETGNLSGKMELSCGAFRENISEGIQILDSITKIHMHCRVEEKFLSENSIPTFILFDSLDARVPDTDFKRKEMLYIEYATIRMDGKIECKDARKIESDVENSTECDLEKTLEEYKNGIDFDIEAVRQNDHAMISISSKFKKIKIIIALPYASRFSYIAITGEHCHISDMEINNTGKIIPKDFIPRIAEEISYINVPAGDIPNVQIDGWRTASSEAIPVRDSMKIRFHSQSLPTSRLIWHCPFVSIFYSDDKKINGPNFREFVLVRLDGENWESDDYSKNTVVINRTDRFAGWDAWKQLNKQGIDCEVNVLRSGRKITITTENLGVAISCTSILHEDFPEVYLALTGDLCAITNIRVEKQLIPAKPKKNTPAAS